MKKAKRILVLILASILILSGCSSVNTSSTGSSSEATVFLTKDEVNLMYSDVKKYKGKGVELIGKVFNDVTYNENDITFQMWGNPEKIEMNTIVSVKDTSIKLKDGDYVKVTGIVFDEFKGKNAFGAELTVPRIKADKVVVITYKDAVAPTIKNVTPSNNTKEQFGYTVTVKNIEFAEKETRVYLSVTNNGKSKFNLYSFNAKIIQDGTQFEEERNYNANYPKIQTDLAVGVTTDGVIAFPKMNISSFKLVLEASSDNWKEKIAPYEFTIDVN